MQNPQNLIWIDLEMTGLNPDTDVIIEMATIVTDSNLNTLAEGPVIAIHQSDEILAGMDEWNTRQHGSPTREASQPADMMMQSWSPRNCGRL